jgi:hypothetical protein
MTRRADGRAGRKGARCAPNACTPTRREALQLGIAATAVGLGGACGSAGSKLAVQAPAPRGLDGLDEALRHLHAFEPLSKQGLSTHAPMVVETLDALGHGDRAVAWIERYDAPVIEIPSPGRPIDREKWREALGPRMDTGSWETALARWADWREFFLAELESARWNDVLDLWCARLAPGISSAATHGVLRTAHAARGLGRRETPERRAELARGLAYWAAAYEELPARSHAPVASSYEDALARIPLYTAAHGAAPAGNIVSGLRAVRTLERFAEVRDDVAAPDGFDAALSQLSNTFAHVYLRHGTRNNAIAFVHAVTGPCALRKLAPHVRAETARAAFPFAWQAAAAIYAGYAHTENAPREIAPSLSREELVARAIENGDEHAIKFTETLLTEHGRSPDPVYLAAAEDAVARL